MNASITQIESCMLIRTFTGCLAEALLYIHFPSYLDRSHRCTHMEPCWLLLCSYTHRPVHTSLGSPTDSYNHHRQVISKTNPKLHRLAHEHRHTGARAHTHRCAHTPFFLVFPILTL